MNQRTSRAAIAAACLAGILQGVGCEREGPKPVTPPSPVAARTDIDRSDELRKKVNDLLARAYENAGVVEAELKDLCFADPKAWFEGHFPPRDASELGELYTRVRAALPENAARGIASLKTVQAEVREVERHADPEEANLPSSLRRSLQNMNPRRAWYIVTFQGKSGKAVTQEWWFVTEGDALRLFEIFPRRPR